MKKLAVALIVLVMCLSMVFAVACGPSVVELDILNDWEGNEVEDVYDISLANGVMTVPYVKGDTYEYMKRAFINETADSLKAVKTLVIEGKLESDYTPLNVILKFEYQQGYDPKEVNFQMSATSRIYEWDVSELNLDHATRMLIFAQGGKVTSGTLIISKLVLTSNPINEENNVTKFPVQTGGPVDTTHEVKTITATDTAIDAGWYDISDGVYTIAKEGTAYKVDFKKNGNQWPGMAAYITGEAIATMKSLVVTLNGTEGTRIMLKPLDDNSLEKIVTLSGGDEEFKVSLGDKAAAADTSAELKIIIIAEPGDTTKVGSFTIKSAALSTEEVVDERPVETVNEIKEGSLSFNNAWYDLGDGVYTIAAVEGGWKVDYANKHEWSMIKAIVNVDEAIRASLKSVKVVLSGTAGQAVLVKAFDNNDLQETVTLTGGDDVVTINLAKVKNIDYSKLMLICAAPNVSGASGSFVIKSAEFSTESAVTPVDPDVKVVNEIKGNDVTVNGGWYDSGDGVYEITKENDGTYTVKTTKAAGLEWATLKALVGGEDLSKIKTLTVTVKGEKDAQIMIKPFNRLEKWVTLSGGTDVVVIDLNVDGINFAEPVYIFGLPGKAEGTLTFQIIDARFSYEVTNVIGDKVLSFSNAWYNLAGSDYTIAATESGWKVDYTKSDTYTFIKANVSVDPAVQEAAKSVKVVVKGTKGDKILVKAFDNWQLEVTATLTGGEDVIIVDLSKADAIDFSKIMLICAAPGDAAATGSFEIISAELVVEAPAAE